MDIKRKANFSLVARHSEKEGNISVLLILALPYMVSQARRSLSEINYSKGLQQHETLRMTAQSACCA